MPDRVKVAEASGAVGHRGKIKALLEADQPIGSMKVAEIEMASERPIGDGVEPNLDRMGGEGGDHDDEDAESRRDPNVAQMDRGEPQRLVMDDDGRHDQ